MSEDSESDCEICGVNDAVHRLPQESSEDLAICDDCAVGRREKVVEGVYAEETIQVPFETTVVVELEAGGRRWEGSPEEFKALRDRLNEIDFRD